MKFLRSVAGYGRTDKKRNTDRKKLKNIQSRREKGIKAELLRTCQPTESLGKHSTITLEEEEIEVDHR
jgi:hypothetical protein